MVNAIGLEILTNKTLGRESYSGKKDKVFFWRIQLLIEERDMLETQ